MKHIYLSLIILYSSFASAQKVNITIDAKKGHHPISPYLYGRNNNVAENGPYPWNLYNEAGLKLYRENQGNNATKYNWKRKLSSHPNWYNNVYKHDWDAIADSIIKNTNDGQGFFAFQLLGKVASDTSYNFKETILDPTNKYRESDLAGGGSIDSTVTPPAVNTGKPELYLKDWPMDSTTAILDSWFKDQKKDSTRLKYWNMDNEPDLWRSTHNDVDTNNYMTIEHFVQNYIKAAKLARAKFNGIKLVGPVFANEWQWYNWNDRKVKPNGAPTEDTYTGPSYTALEYFIKRVAEAQDSSGIRLLDVFDLHFYYGYTVDKGKGHVFDPKYAMQLHRIWFDTTFVYKEASGVKRVTPGMNWDDTQNKDYVFLRVNKWLDHYFGKDHHITLAVSEIGAIAEGPEDPNIVAIWYASHLGTFADHGVEVFAPWDWLKGQWEVLSLFSNYYGKISAQTFNNDTIVSAYSSLSSNGDSLIIAIVNRDTLNAREVSLELNNFIPSVTTAKGYQLADLPANEETYKSRADNALQQITASVSDNVASITVPPLSVTLVAIPTDSPVLNVKTPAQLTTVAMYPNPMKDKLEIDIKEEGNYQVMINNLLNVNVGNYRLSSSGVIEVGHLSSGSYFIQIVKDDKVLTQKFIKE